MQLFAEKCRFSAENTALIANIRNQERAEFIYQQRVRNLLGSTLKASGALFYNIN